MSESLGPSTFGEAEELVFLGKEIHDQQNYSEKTSELIDAEIGKLINGAMNTARAIILKERQKLETVAQTLLEKETLEREAFEALFTSA